MTGRVSDSSWEFRYYYERLDCIYEFTSPWPMMLNQRWKRSGPITVGDFIKGQAVGTHRMDEEGVIWEKLLPPKIS